MTGTSSLGDSIFCLCFAALLASSDASPVEHDMSTASVIVDDFESIIQYSNNLDFYTPDPSDAAVIQTEKCGESDREARSTCS